jgi:tRNA(fMet)-specific endonuclease VapC
MIRYLLDTDVLSEPAKRQPNSFVLGRLQREAWRCATSAVVWMEMSYGVLRMPLGARRDRLRTYVTEVGRQFSIVPFDAEAALWLATARARQNDRGITRPKYDGIIAATAAAHGLILITRNVRDFADFPGLTVESWHG